jgi:hypothetical protein
MPEDADMERIITAVTNAVSNMIAPMKVQLTTLETGQKAHTARFDALEGRFNALEAGQHQLIERVERLETGL